VESVPRRRFQEATFDRGNARGTESLQTRRWSKGDYYRTFSSNPPRDHLQR
jgi:hypothetical protein